MSNWSYLLILMLLVACKPSVASETSQGETAQASASQQVQTTAQKISELSNLDQNDPVVAANLTSFSKMCSASESRVGDMLAKTTQIVNEKHPEVTIADVLREAVKTQPGKMGGKCEETLGMLAAFIQAAK